MSTKCYDQRLGAKEKESVSIRACARSIRQPAFKVKEVDATGAGDVFDGAFVVGLLLGWKLETALRFACAAGAIKVTRQGPMEGPTSKAEVEEFLTRNDQ
ncbi:MAG: carbohydrate kinase family protein [Aigarchaeota archaeon]|nr:carbohydrate kinase family protein [Aigarchaeota archaeon]MDH5703290.1 carbohydrate kinase family protein [Aigarchaeota archaeon]